MVALLPFCLSSILWTQTAPAQIVERQKAATLILEGDGRENNILKLRYSSYLRITVTVEGGEGLFVEDFTPEIDSKVWQVQPRTPGRVTRLSARRRQWRVQLELEPVRPGKLLAPAVSLRYGEDGEGPRQPVKWSGTEVEVVGPEDADLKDIRGVPPLETLPEKPSWWRPYSYVVGLLAGAALGVLGVGLWLRRRRPTSTLPPDQRALEELALLESSVAPAGARPDWFHTALSALVCRYLEARFSVRATRQTTREVLEEMRQQPELAEPLRQLLHELLTRCDLAKFAGMALDPAERAEAAALARTLIQEATPKRLASREA